MIAILLAAALACAQPIELFPAMPVGHVVALARGGGALWVGTFDSGVAAYSSGTWRRWTEREGLPSDWIADLAWDGERLWGVGEAGVFFIEGGAVGRPPQPELRRPGRALYFHEGALYVAQPGAVLRCKDGLVERLPVPELHPQDLYVDARGAWLAGLEGLYRLSGSGVRRLSGEALPSDWVTAVAAGPDGGVLLGTYDKGLALLPSGGRRARPLLRQAWVSLRAIAVSGDRVAVGGMEEGLWLRQGGAWKRLTSADGLPWDDVSAVLFEGDSLWVGTRRGLARLARIGP